MTPRTAVPRLKPGACRVADVPGERLHGARRRAGHAGLRRGGGVHLHGAGVRADDGARRRRRSAGARCAVRQHDHGPGHAAQAAGAPGRAGRPRGEGGLGARPLPGRRGGGRQRPLRGAVPQHQPQGETPPPSTFPLLA